MCLREDVFYLKIYWIPGNSPSHFQSTSFGVKLSCDAFLIWFIPNALKNAFFFFFIFGWKTNCKIKLQTDNWYLSQKCLKFDLDYGRHRQQCWLFIRCFFPFALSQHFVIRWIWWWNWSKTRNSFYFEFSWIFSIITSRWTKFNLIQPIDAVADYNKWVANVQQNNVWRWMWNCHLKLWLVQPYNIHTYIYIYVGRQNLSIKRSLDAICLRYERSVVVRIPSCLHVVLH